MELENIYECIYINIYMALLELGTPYAQGTVLSGCVTFIVDKRNWQRNKRTKLKLQEREQSMQDPFVNNRHQRADKLWRELVLSLGVLCVK